MHEHARRDNELATFTDQLLAGEEPDMQELDDLAHVVRQLHEVIAPHEKPTAAFRTQLAQRLEMEWALQRRQPPHWWATRRVRQALALAASLLVLAGAAIWFSWPHESNNSLRGTALGSATGVLVAVVVVLAGLGVFMFYRHKR